jgi:hypothetical protein
MWTNIGVEKIDRCPFHLKMLFPFKLTKACTSTAYLLVSPLDTTMS